MQQNSQYHDYAELFKDADCKAENKVVEYLGEY